MIQKVRTFYREYARDFLAQYWLPVAAFACAALLALNYIDPAPPRHIEISSGAEEGAFQVYAERYKAILARDGVALKIRPSNGSPQNLQRLTDPRSGVDIGFLQGGFTTPEDAPGLRSLGSMYYVPLWIFMRVPADGVVLSRLSQLRGMRIAAGVEGGGTYNLATRLLRPAGVNERNASLLPLSGRDAANALLEKRVDAAMFLTTLDAPHVQQLLAMPDIRLMNLDQADAYVRNFPFLHKLVLPRGSFDLENNLPAEDVQLLAPTATLVAREGVHPALVSLLLKAATEVHGGASLLQKEHEFPGDRDVDLPISPEAARYYKSGPPFLQKYLPFWLATLLDRMFVVLLPMLAILIPLTKLAPLMYSWRIRSRVYHWYGELKFLEGQLRDLPDAAAMPALLERLDWIEDRVNRIRLPLAFSNHVYFLREHIELVRNAFGRASRKAAADDTATGAGHGAD